MAQGNATGASKPAPLRFYDNKSLLYSDTAVPDVFITEYLPSLKSEYVKIYLYCLFLAGRGKSPSIAELSHTLELDVDTIKKGLLFMNNLEILTWSEEGVVVTDLKEKEIQRLYRRKSATPEDAIAALRGNEKRRQAVLAINDTFFSGAMNPQWLMDMHDWFEEYGFEEDAMFMLFQHCYNNNVLTRNYIAAVAQSWKKKGIRNVFDVERYLKGYQEMKAVSRKVARRLRMGGGKMNFHEEQLVDKWVNQFGQSFEVIDEALRLSIYKKNATLMWFDGVLEHFHKHGLDTVEKIEAYPLFVRALAGDAKAPYAMGAGGQEAQQQGEDSAVLAAAGLVSGAVGVGGGAVGVGGGRGGQRRRSYSQKNFSQRPVDSYDYSKLVTNQFGFGPKKPGRAAGQAFSAPEAPVPASDGIGSGEQSAVSPHEGGDAL